MKKQILTIAAFLTVSISAFAQQAFDAPYSVTCGGHGEASEVVTAMAAPIYTTTPKSEVSARINAYGEKVSGILLDILTEKEEAINAITEEDLQLWMKDAACLFVMLTKEQLIDKTRKRQIYYSGLVKARLKQNIENLSADDTEHKRRIMNFMKVNEIFIHYTFAFYDKRITVAPELAL